MRPNSAHLLVPPPSCSAPQKDIKTSNQNKQTKKHKEKNKKKE